MQQSNSAFSILDIILNWSTSRPAWQQDALRRLVQSGTPTTNDLIEVHILLQKEHGLIGTDIFAVPLAAEHLTSNPDNEASVQLISLENIFGVNQISSDQRVEFEKHGITIIYGDNGTGKSGYVRVLKKACQTRHMGTIISNVFENSPVEKATANINIAIENNSDIENINWQDSDFPHPTLSKILVFDKDCAIIHVREKNKVVFRPFGLNILHELASLNNMLKDEVNKEIEIVTNSQNDNFRKISSYETTVVGKFLSSLTSNSDINILKSYGELTNEQVERMNILKGDLQKDPIQLSSEHKVYAESIKNIIESMRVVASVASDEVFEKIMEYAGNARSKKEAANIAARNAFENLQIKGVGSDVWRTLWEAARSYASAVFPGQPFPPTGDSLCVLCHTSLDAAAKDRMRSFEQFIQMNVNAQAEDAKNILDSEYNRFKNNTNYIRSTIQLVQETPFANQNLAARVKGFLETALSRHIAFSNSFEAGTASERPVWPTSPIKELMDLEAHHRSYASQIAASSDPEARERLKNELEELIDRSHIPGMLPYVEEEIERLRRLTSLQRCIQDLNTRSITNLGNKIADEMITPQMQGKFQDELTRLVGNKIRVETVRSGGEYGSPQYQIQFMDSPETPVYDILSEGEFVIVAIAAFMAELTTASHNSSLVFDDPVSSLDHKWKGKVARRLTEEALVRQVVIFSHDIGFINEVITQSNLLNIPKKELTLVCDSRGTGIVRQGLVDD